MHTPLSQGPDGELTWVREGAACRQGLWPAGFFGTWSCSQRVLPDAPQPWAEPPRVPLGIHFPLCWAFCQGAWECEGPLPQASLPPARAVMRSPCRRLGPFAGPSHLITVRTATIYEPPLHARGVPSTPQTSSQLIPLQLRQIVTVCSPMSQVRCEDPTARPPLYSAAVQGEDGQGGTRGPMHREGKWAHSRLADPRGPGSKSPLGTCPQ